MKLIVYGPLGVVPLWLNDDATQEEIAQKIHLACTVEQGNGRERTKYEYGKYAGVRPKCVPGT